MAEWKEVAGVARPPLASLRGAALLLSAVLFPAGYATAGAVLLLLTSLPLAIRRPSALWQRTPMDLPLALLVGSLALSALRSPQPALAGASTLLLAVLILLAYGAAAATISRVPGFLLLLVLALGAGMFETALWGTAIFLLGGSPAHTMVMGANSVGTTLATGLPLLLGLFLSSAGAVRRVAGIALVVTVAGLTVTFVRGAWLAGAAGLFLFLAMRPRRALRPVAALLLLAGIVAAVGLTIPSPLLERRAITFFALSGGRDRVAIWRASLAIVRDHPLLGTGLNTFGSVYPRYRLAEDPSPGQPFAHNILLNMAVEGGILGLAAFVAVIVTAGVLGARWVRRSGDAEGMRAAGVVGAAAAFMVHQQLDGTALAFHIGFGLWLLLGIIAARGGAAAEAAPTARAG